MKDYKRVISKRLFLSMMLNPLVICVYCIFMYGMYEICKWGITMTNSLIILIPILFTIIWFVLFIIRQKRGPVTVPQCIIDNYRINENSIIISQNEYLIIDLNDIKSFNIGRKYGYIVLINRDILVLNMRDKTIEEIREIRRILNSNVRVKSIYKKIYFYLYIAILVVVLVFCGYKIYDNAINYNSRLTWVIEDLLNKKTIKFKHNNIYKYGVDGIFSDIKEKIHMPEKLYISDDFNLTFSTDGKITSFDTYVYGSDDRGKTKSFLINYDVNNSEKITIHCNGYVDGDYNNDKLLQPLKDTIRAISLENTINKSLSKQFKILYLGKRDWGYNNEGIIYIDSKGNKMRPKECNNKIVGYTVSIFIQGEENKYVPIRCNLIDYMENNSEYIPSKSNDNNDSCIEWSSQELNDNRNTSEKIEDIDKDKEVYVSDGQGYKLVTTDAATGSRFYELRKTFDGGKTWRVVNKDPFLGTGGIAEDIKFINDKIGFLILSKNGGDNANLYRTEDGGVSFKKVGFPEFKVKTDEGASYDPFDFPNMPYEDNGMFNVLVRQGADGDYNGGCEGLYQSEDQGKTWEFVKEITHKD